MNISEWMNAVFSSFPEAVIVEDKGELVIYTRLGVEDETVNTIEPQHLFVALEEAS